MSKPDCLPARPFTANVIALLVLLQAVIYLVAAPSTVAAMQGNWNDYLFIIIQFIVFFLVPFVSILALAPSARSRPILSVQINTSRLALLTLFFVGFELVYWYTVSSVGLMTRRIGTEVIAEVFSTLTFPQLLIIRLHDTLAIAMPALVLLVAVRATDRMQRRVGWLLFALAAASFAAHTLLNSRLQFVMGLALVAAILMQLVSARLRLGTVVRGLFAAVLVLYTLTVISNLRNAVANEGELTTEIFDPTALTDDPAFQGASAVIAREWIQRLDCADLVDRMHNSLERHGFELGHAWYYPVFMLYGAISDPEKYVELKRDAMTTAKAYLLDRHTDLELRDYYSCALTDAYANFWVFGYLIAALYFGIAARLVHRAICSSSPTLLIIGILAFVHVSAFESELIAHLLGWLRLVPVAIVLIVLSPIVRIRRADLSTDFRK